MRKYYIHVLLILLGTVLYFMANFQRVAIPGAIFDTLQADLNLTAPAVTTFGAVFMYVYAISLLAIGIFVDRFGGIKVILAGGIFFTIGSLLFANTQNLALLYIARGILGLGAATFYLSLVKEIKKCFPDKYFGIAISIMLFSGYLGGVCANAPFNVLAHNFGWQNVLNILGIIIFLVTITYGLVQLMIKSIPENLNANFSIEPFKKVIRNIKNRNLFIFGCLNYGLYYVIQTVIGVKFLKDFTNISNEKASFILSAMVIIAAFSGIGLATLSKLFGNKRIIFMKAIAIMSCSLFAIISIALLFNIQTQYLAIAFLLIAIGGGMSPLLVPIIHETNDFDVRGTALSVMNCAFFLSVGILGTIVGFLLDLFTPIKNSNGHLIYTNWSYLGVFGTFFIVSLIEIFNIFKLKDNN